jgi:hypothetical protein
MILDCPVYFTCTLNVLVLCTKKGINTRTYVRYIPAHNGTEKKPKKRDNEEEEAFPLS